MASDNIGLICGANTGTIYAIINPDSEAELDNPRWLLIQVGTAEEREPLTMLRMPRAAYMACTTHAQVQAFATAAFRRHVA